MLRAADPPTKPAQKRQVFVQQSLVS
jgi:hypothetical protein